MKFFEKYTMPLGMVGVIAYLTHTLLGRLLWREYNPITTDISSLTAVGAPNRELLMIFTLIYGVSMLLFIAGLVIKSFRNYQWGTRTGYIILIIMQTVSFFGYSFFPLTGDKTVMNFQNMMHIVVTVIVVFTTIASGYFLAFGYLKQEKIKRFGSFILIMSIIITITGVSNPIGMGAGLNILGLTERLVIYSVQLLMFVISAYYTFKNFKNAVNPEKNN